jgi:hypothetical protein
VEDPGQKLEELELQLGFKVPLKLKKLLISIGGAVMFDVGIKFKPLVASPMDDMEGFQNLEIFYGPGSNEFSMAYNQDMYSDQIPHGYIPIGGAPGGNQICLGPKDSIYYWHHEDPGEGLYLIAHNFIDFLALFEEEQETPRSLDGIIESESWLDF